MADAIVLDLGLPDRSGISSLKAVRRAFPDVPVVVLTGSDDDDLLTDALAQGAQDFFVKGREAWTEVLTRLENAVHRSRRSQAVHDAERFLAHAAHDLRVPLQSLQAGLWRLKRPATGAGRPAGPIDARAIEALEQGTADLGRLVEGMLDYARSGAVHATAVDVRQAMQEMQAAIASEVERRNARVEAHGHGEVHADPALLQMLLRNLVLNGIRHGNPQSPTVRVSWRRHGLGAALRVEDDGPGVAPEDLPRLGRPFERLAGHGEGTGLGLSVAARIVEAHGGRVHFGRARLGGLEVRVEFPAPAAGVAARPAAADAA